MNDGWEDLQNKIHVGDGIRYWSKTRGYTYGTFVMTSIEELRVKFTIPSGEELSVTKRDYQDTAARLDGFSQEKLSSADIKKSFKAAYIFSLARQLRSGAAHSHNWIPSN